MYFLKRNSIPPVNPDTALALLAIIFGTSMSTEPVMVMPCVAKSFFASLYRCDECSSALDGMHPTFRHVPPSVPRPSTHAVFKPSCDALIAAT